MGSGGSNNNTPAPTPVPSESPTILTRAPTMFVTNAPSVDFREINFAASRGGVMMLATLALVGILILFGTIKVVQNTKKMQQLESEILVLQQPTTGITKMF